MIKFIRNLFNSIKQQCNIPDVSKSYCECSFVMIRRDQKTQKAYCFECKKEVQE